MSQAHPLPARGRGGRWGVGGRSGRFRGGGGPFPGLSENARRKNRRHPLLGRRRPSGVPRAPPT
jgi:hypothetical protein